MERGKPHAPEVKAAVMAALLEGQSISKAAKEYRVPEGTVKRWRANSKDFREPVGQEKRGAIGDLLLTYLHTNLETLRIQSEHFQDKTWLVNQDAADRAVLHGVVADKTVRLLEALAGDLLEELGTQGGLKIGHVFYPGRDDAE